MISNLERSTPTKFTYDKSFLDVISKPFMTIGDRYVSAALKTDVELAVTVLLVVTVVLVVLVEVVDSVDESAPHELINIFRKMQTRTIFK